MDPLHQVRETLETVLKLASEHRVRVVLSVDDHQCNLSTYGVLDKRSQVYLTADAIHCDPLNKFQTRLTHDARPCSCRVDQGHEAA